MTPDTSPRESPPEIMPSQLHYTFVVQWSDEDDAFVATCPEWPGLSYVSENRLVAIARLEPLIVEACRVWVAEGKVPPALPREAVMNPILTPLSSGETINVPRAEISDTMLAIRKHANFSEPHEQEWLENLRDRMAGWLTESTPAEEE